MFYFFFSLCVPSHNTSTTFKKIIYFHVFIFSCSEAWMIIIQYVLYCYDGDADHRHAAVAVTVSLWVNKVFFLLQPVFESKMSLVNVEKSLKLNVLFHIFEGKFSKVYIDIKALILIDV